MVFIWNSVGYTKYKNNTITIKITITRNTTNLKCNFLCNLGAASFVTDWIQNTEAYIMQYWIAMANSIFMFLHCIVHCVKIIILYTTVRNSWTCMWIFDLSVRYFICAAKFLSFVPLFASHSNFSLYLLIALNCV